MFNGTILESWGEDRINSIISQLSYECSNEHCPLSIKSDGQVMHLHHLFQWADSKNGDWSNLTYICPYCHDRIHKGYWNGRTFKSIEVQVYEKLGLVIPTKTVQIDCRKMSVYVVVPEDDYHIPYLIGERNSRKNTKVPKRRTHADVREN